MSVSNNFEICLAYSNHTNEKKLTDFSEELTSGFSIFEFTKDEQKTFDMIEKIMASRQVTEKVNLKRVKNRESVIKKSDKEM